MTLNNTMPSATTRDVVFRRHKKIWQAHIIDQPTIYYEAKSLEDAKKRALRLLKALGFDVSDEKKVEFRQLPLAVLKGES